MQQSPHRKKSGHHQQPVPPNADPSLYADIEALQQKAQRIRRRLESIEKELNLLRSEILDPEADENAAQSV